MLVKGIHDIGPTSSDFASAVSDLQRCLSQKTCCYRRNSTMNKYNTRSDHTEPTQCYVCQLAANCRSAMVSLSIHNNIKNTTTMLTRQRLIESNLPCYPSCPSSLMLSSDSLSQRQIIRTCQVQHSSTQPTRTESTSSKTHPSIVQLCYITHPPIHLSSLHFIKYKQTYTHSLVSHPNLLPHSHFILTKAHSFPSKTNQPSTNKHNGRFRLHQHRRSRQLLHRIPWLPRQDVRCPEPHR
jgi:hypothetical protein